MVKKTFNSPFYITIIIFILFQIQIVLTIPAPQNAKTTNVAPSSTSSAPVATSTPTGGITVSSNCVIDGVVALSFDDGPFSFTSELLDVLDTENVTATFFVNGFNYGCIYDFAGM